MQSKFDYIPPNLVSEGLEFQLDRVVKLAKAARSDLSQVTGGHLNLEEHIIISVPTITNHPPPENIYSYLSILSYLHFPQAIPGYPTILAYP